MNVKFRHCLSAALFLGCLFVATGRSQYVEDSIQVPGAWVGSLAYDPEHDEVWGATWSGNCVFAISCSSNTVVASIPLSWAGDLVYDSTDGKLYCAYYGPEQESLAVISGATHQVVKRLEMPGSTTPVWDAVSDRVYVSCQSTNSVAVLDCRTDSLIRYIPVGACPMKMYINTLRRKLYVLNYDGGSVSVIDLATSQVIKTVVVGGYPNAGYYCRSADKFYSAGPHEQCVVIGGLSDTIVARVHLPGIEDVFSATGNENAGLVYLGTFSGHDDYVAIVSAQKDSVLATAMVGRDPMGLAYSSQSGLLYCASSWSDKVVVVTGDGARILRTLQVGDCPFVFALVPRHNRLYLGHLGGTYVYVLRDTAAAITEPRSPRPEFCGALSVTPNPFRGAVSVEISSHTRGATRPAELMVCSEDGRVVRRLGLSWRAEGASCTAWDGCDLAGVPVPAGVYVVTTSSGDCLKVVKAE